MRWRQSGQLGLAYVGFALLALVIVAMQAVQFAGRAYDHNEDWAVHWSLNRTEGLPDVLLDSGYPALDVWIGLFGAAEPVTRGLSALWLLLALALLLRLGAELFGRRAGRLAVVLAGASAGVQFFGGQAQPYALLLALVVGLHMSLWRWLRRRDRRAVLPVAVLALLTAYTYPPALWTLAGAGVYALWFEQRSFTRVLAGLALAAVLALLGAAVGQDRTFDVWSALELAQPPLSLTPPAFVQTALLVGLAVSVALVYPLWGQPLRVNAPSDRRPFAYIALVIASQVAIQALMPSSTARLPFLLLMIPFLAMLGGATMAVLSSRAQVIVVMLFLLPAVLSFGGFLPPLSYRQVAALVDPNEDARVVVAAPYAWQHLPLMAYLSMPPDRSFHLLLEQEVESARLLTPTIKVETMVDDAALDRLMAWADNTPVIWLFVQFDAPHTASLELRLRQQYAESARGSWLAKPSPRGDYGMWVRYLRIPDDLRDSYRFGDDLWLLSWRLRDSVQVRACDTVQVESWWRVKQQADANVSLTLVLADANGQGVARTDRLIASLESRLWPPEQPQLDERELTIPCDLPAGEYPLLIGTYVLSSDNRLTTLDATLPDGSPLGSLVYLTTLVVTVP